MKNKNIPIFGAGALLGALGVVAAVSVAGRGAQAQGATGYQPSAGEQKQAERAILRITGDWPRALVQSDRRGVERIVSRGTAHFIESDGRQYDRAGYLVSRTQNAGEIRSVAYTHRQVRVLAPNVAVMWGRSVVNGDRRLSVSNIFMRQNGEWRLVHGHLTPANADPNWAKTRMNPVRFPR